MVALIMDSEVVNDVKSGFLKIRQRATNIPKEFSITRRPLLSLKKGRKLVT